MNKFYNKLAQLYEGEQQTKTGFLKHYADIMRDGKRLFRDSVADEMVYCGRLPYGKALTLTIHILALQKGKRDSTLYENEHYRLSILFLKFKSRNLING